MSLSFRTAKEYMTIEMMKFYVNSIFVPYMKAFLNQFSDQSLNYFLLADNHEAPTHPDTLSLLQRTGIVPIWLPPDSGHFLQRLDLAGFGSLGKYYRNLRRPEVKPQLKGKILPVLYV
jgi:hypothetical protein